MLSERVQRGMDVLLDEGETTISAGRWSRSRRKKAHAVLAIDAANPDALAFLRMAEANAGVTTPEIHPSATRLTQHGTLVGTVAYMSDIRVSRQGVVDAGLRAPRLRLKPAAAPENPAN
jgi:hypothetical protein